MNIYKKLPCEIKEIVNIQQSKLNHNDLMNEINTNKELHRCIKCNCPIHWDIDIDRSVINLMIDIQFYKVCILDTGKECFSIEVCKECLK